MSDLREAAEMALEAMDNEESPTYKQWYGAIEALRQALVQPEQEPVAWMWKDGSLTTDPDEADGTWTKLYTAPPKREWVGLTDEQQHEFVRNYGGDVISKLALVKAIEAKLKEKNA